MNPSELKNLDYDFNLVAVADRDGTITILIIPTMWFESNNIDDPQDVYDNREDNEPLYVEMLTFPELNNFYSLLK